MTKPSLQKRHFERMAKIVDNIRRGYWTNEFPEWAAKEAEPAISHYARAVYTAEAFLSLAQDSNDLFDEDRFLRACGLK